MKTETPASWTEFIEIVYRVQDVLRSPFPDASGEPWFRGQSAKYPLDPKLHRRFRKLDPLLTFDCEQAFWRMAHTFYSKYRTLGASLLSMEDQFDAWRTLTSMRHHEVPVQLLDWTTSFAAALFFALRSSAADGVEAVVYCLDPEGLNLPYLGKRSLVIPGPPGSTGKVAGYHTAWPVKDGEPRPTTTIALSPVMSHPRLVAQAGRFTISGWNAEPIECDFPDSVALRVVLPRAAEPEARQFLLASGESDFTLFPDLDGLARALITQADLELQRSLEFVRQAKGTPPPSR